MPSSKQFKLAYQTTSAVTMFLNGIAKLSPAQSNSNSVGWASRKQNKLEASLSWAWHSSVPACYLPFLVPIVSFYLFRDCTKTIVTIKTIIAQNKNEEVNIHFLKNAQATSNIVSSTFCAQLILKTANKIPSKWLDVSEGSGYDATYRGFVRSS